jgi:hypothetical protein
MTNKIRGSQIRIKHTYCTPHLILWFVHNPAEGGILKLTIVAKETEIKTMEMLLRSMSRAVAAAVGTTAINIDQPQVHKNLSQQ